MKYYKVGYEKVLESNDKIRINEYYGNCDYYKINMYAYEKNGRIFDFLTNEELFLYDLFSMEKGKLYYSALEEVDTSEILSIISLLSKNKNWFNIYKERLEYIKSDISYLIDTKNSYHLLIRRNVSESIKLDKF